MNKRDLVTIAIDDMPTDELISVWNEFCNQNNYSNQIYHNKPVDFDAVFGENPLFYDVLKAFDGEFDTGLDYFSFDDSKGVYRLYDSANDIIDKEEIIQSALDYDDDFGNIYIRHALDDVDREIDEFEE